MESIGEYEYSKKDLIGHGAFAMVFKGRQKKKHDFVVAIKCITKKNLAKSQNLLSKEIKILKELSDLQHENVVQLLDCKETSHHVYLIMEYCNGGDLADYLQAKGTLSEDTISLFLRQIAGAMKALTEKGIVHRDLKPQNILLCHSGNPNPQPGEMKLKIADFGFARFLQDGVMAATLCGSPMYMAPEVIMSLQYDAKADLWSIGTIVYQCLTGKAPFQATTPQQLKQFYEKNANLQPNLPPGTSPELKNLLMGMLRRNARERIDFEVFFQHAFLVLKGVKSSSPVPVPVPRSRSRGSLGESPTLKQVTASPLSGRMAASPPQPIIRRKERVEPMDMGSPTEADEYMKVEGRCTSPTEGFVLVPENIPSDASISSNGSQRPASVDLNAIFSDNSPDSPKFTHRHSQRASPYGNVQHRKTGTSPKQTAASPGRPSTLQVVSPTGNNSPKSEPIPVPSQVKAFEQIQRSMGQSPSSPIRQSPSSLSPKQYPSSAPSGGIAIPKKTASNTSLASIGSMSPPSVQFSIGTPPNSTWSRRNSCPITIKSAPQNQNSPFKKTATVSPRIATAVFNTTTLPPIVGSPVKTSGNFHIGPSDDSPPSGPLHTPFGGAMGGRTMTCPDNIGAVGFDTKCVVPLKTSLERCPSEPQLQVEVQQRNQNSSRLSEQLLRAAFGTPNQGLPGQRASSPPGVMVPYGSNTSLNRAGSNTSLNNRQRRYSGTDEGPYAQSPPNMEGPISFVAPELAEDVLMDKDHNDTVAKLNFIVALVECVIELAQSRSSPLTESTAVMDPKQPGSFQIDHLSFMSEGQRLVEQLVLYIRALQLLTSSIELAKTEIMAQKLQPSNSVKSILKDMKNYYHQCLAVCKNLHSKGVTNNLDKSQYSGVTADKLIYNYAFEMCQTAVVDEMYGNTEDCFRHYKNAQILLHSLAHQAHDQHDKDILNKYREAVEKRLFNLRDQGLINAVNSTFS